jgi:hypothetical protein
MSICISNAQGAFRKSCPAVICPVYLLFSNDVKAGYIHRFRKGKEESSV